MAKYKVHIDEQDIDIEDAKDADDAVEQALFKADAVADIVEDDDEDDTKIQATA